MSTTTNNMYHACTRKTMEEINIIIDNINSIVKTKGYITKNDLFGYCLGEVPFNDEYNYVGWTAYACEHAALTTCKNYYNLYLPQPDWNYSKYEKEGDEMNRYHAGIFDDYIDAFIALDRAIGTAECYGHATIADILGFAENEYTYADTKRGWTELCARKGYIHKTDKGWTISLPKCNWFDDASMIKASDEQPQPEPINITIPAEKPEIIKETINSLCDNLEKIKDHPVFITIV